MRRLATGVRVVAAAGVVAVTLPTMAVEEFWHGRPMIDQPGRLWVVPALVVLAAFAVGGFVAVRRSHRLSDGLVIGVLAAAALVAADVVRRHWITHQGYPAAVAGLWLGCGAVLIAASAAAGVAAEPRWHRA